MVISEKDRGSAEAEEKIICPTYEGLVRTLAEAMEIDEEKLYGEPEAGFDHEDIMSWIGLVDFKEGNVPDIQANLSSERGRTITKIDVQKQRVIGGIDEKATKEQLIYSMALTEAKMKVIAETAGEVYPAVAFQINDLRKEMEKVREEILRNKEERVSLNNIINMRSARGAFLVTTALLALAVIVSCTKNPITETPAEGTRPTATLAQPATEAFTPSPTVTVEATQTATATPIEIPTLPPVVQEYVNQFPDAGFDASGLHVHIADTGTKIDISSDFLEQGLRVDSFGLLQVFDDQGTIIAEYDPEQKTWIDIQKLATTLICQKGETCFNKAEGAPIPNGMWVELRSTGIFRSIDSIDKKTGDKIGTFLIVQMVTKDSEGAPVTVWELVQAESLSDPGVNAFSIVASTMQVRVEHRSLSDFDYKTLYSVDQWKEWMKYGSDWTFGFSKDGRHDPWYPLVQSSQLGTSQNQAETADFLSSGGLKQFNSLILLLQGSTGR